MNKPYSTYRISINHEDTVKVDWSDFTTRKRGNGVEGKLNYQTKIFSNPEALSLIEAASADSLSDRASTRQLGEFLFDALFDERLRFKFLEIYRNVKQQDGYLRVELDIDENRLTQIAAMPWEFMCLPKNLSQEDIWLAADPHIAFSRSRPQDAIPESLRLAEGEKLKIAVVASKPSDLGEVDIEPVQKVLAKLKNDYGNKIEVLPIVSHAIVEEIEKILDKNPHIFHFIGHGQLAECDGSEQGQIALVDELFGEADWKDADSFAGLFTRHTPGIVLMQACEGAMRSESKALVDVAAKIGQQNVRVVVAMQYEVTNRTAGRFAVKFYECLAKGLPVDIAVQEGRFNVARNQQYQGRDFATPVLFSGVKDGYLFHLPNEDEMSPEELREATLILLQEIEDEFNKTHLFHTRRSITIDIEEQYVPIQVTLEPHKRDIETLGSYAETEEELKRAYAARGGEEKAEEELKQQELDWHEAKQKHQHIMVLADPGMGKSTLLREEARTIAHQEWQHLKNKKKSVEKIIIPIFVRLPELAEQLKEPSTLVTDAILSLLERKYQSVFQKFPKFKSVIKERLQLLKEQGQVEKCHLLFDALDEVPKNARNNLVDKLNDYARNFSCSIICTSRIVGYDGRCINDSKEMEIIPFRDRQIERYIKNWFKNASESLSDKSVTATGLIQELRSKPQVRGLVQNPLLLSLICSLYQQEGLTLPTRRCELYEQAVYYMLGQWNIDNRRSNTNEQNTEDGWILTKKELLEELAYQFSCEGEQLFELGKLRKNLEEYLKSGSLPTDLMGVKSTQLIKELSEEDGILQLWTKEDKRLPIEKRRYLFLHRTFQEYLTACYLKRAEDGIDLAKKHFWDYDWHETISLMAGLMENSLPLLKAITDEKDDIFKTQLLLAGRCIAECKEYSHPLITEIIERIYQFLETYPDAEFIRSVLVAIGQTHSLVSEKLLETSGDKSTFKEALQRINDKNVLPILQKIINDNAVSLIIDQIRSISLGDTYSRVSLISLLGKLRNVKSVNFLISELDFPERNFDEDSFEISQYSIGEVRSSVVDALGEIGNYQATNALILALNSNLKTLRKITMQEYYPVRCSAVRALKTIGSKEAIEGLEQALKTIDDTDTRIDVKSALYELRGMDKYIHDFITELYSNDLTTRCYAINSLAIIQNEDAIEALITAFKDDSWRDDSWRDDSWRNQTTSVIEAMIWKFAEINKNNEKIVDALISELNKENLDIYKDLRHYTALALGRKGNDKAVDSLIRRFNDTNFPYRQWMLKPLGKIGNEKAIKALISALNSTDSSFRKEALNALCELGELGNEDAVDALIKALNSEYPDVKQLASWALVQVPNERGIASIIELLKDDRGDKEKLIGALVARGTYEYHGLSDKDKILKENVVKLLKRVENERVVDVLIAELNNSNVTSYISETRSYAKSNLAELLAEIGSIKAIDSIFAALDDIDCKHHITEFRRFIASCFKPLLYHKELEVRKYIVELLRDKKTTDSIIVSINDMRVGFSYPTNEVVLPLLALSKIGSKEAIDTIYEFYLRKHDNYALAQLAMAAVIDENEYAYDVLLKVQSPIATYEYQSEFLEKNLVNIGNKRAIEFLIESLNHDNPIIRASAEKALLDHNVKINDLGAIESLIEALKHDNLSIKQIAAKVLGKTNNTKAIDALFEAFKNNNDSDFFVLALTPAIDNTNYDIESYITKVLEHKGNEKIIDIFISALNNNQSYAVKNIYSSKLLARLVQFPELDIYRPDFFFMARKLAIRFSKKDLYFIPVYPENVVGLKDVR